MATARQLVLIVDEGCKVCEGVGLLPAIPKHRHSYEWVPTTVRLGRLLCLCVTATHETILVAD